jgi:MFS family permease
LAVAGDTPAWRAWIALLILCLVGLLGASSGALLSILVEPIKTSLALSDTAIGLITGLAIAGVSAVAAFPIGAAADRFGRRRVLALCMIAWSAGTALMGAAPTSAVLVGGVVGINLGDAALLPMLYAMVPALFSDRHRHLANSLLVATLVMGSYAVYGLAGLLLGFFERTGFAGLEPWRAVCLAVAGLGALLAALLVAIPAVASKAGGKIGTPGLTQADFAGFLRAEGRTILLTFIATSIYYSGFGLILFWAPAILERRFGLTTAAANVALGFPLAAASGVGLLLASAILWRFAGRWGSSAGLRLMQIGCAIAVPFAAALPFAANERQFVALMIALSICFAVCLALVPLVLQNCAPDRFRSRTIALFPVVALAFRILFPGLAGHLSARAGESGSALTAIVAAIFGASLVVSIILLQLVREHYGRLADRVARDEGLPEPSPAVS